MMSAAVDVRVFIEVNEIDQQLDTDYTDEARRVPDDVTSGPTGEHRQLALLHSFTALNIRHIITIIIIIIIVNSNSSNIYDLPTGTARTAVGRSTTPAQQSAELAAR